MKCIGCDTKYIGVVTQSNVMGTNIHFIVTGTLCRETVTES